MKKQKIIFSIILIEIMTATIKIDNIESKYMQLNIIEKVEQQVETIKERFEVQPEYELEVVNEYILGRNCHVQYFNYRWCWLHWKPHCTRTLKSGISGYCI